MPLLTNFSELDRTPVDRQDVPFPPQELILALQDFDQRYDPSLAMPWGEVPEIQYHTKLSPHTPVHTTRDAADYAFILLESGDAERLPRAHDILRHLIGLQDARENSRFYGLWSWFYEESLDQMSPVDFNWADFIGTQLTQSLWRRSALLEENIRHEVSNAIRRAAHSIIRRNVDMAYTNIALMGTYVTVKAGEILDDREILQYGRDRLRRFAKFTEDWDGFPEYNSPNYLAVGITEISRMLRDFTREEDLEIVHHLNERAWKEIAIHWHPPSTQWAGPHSRSYQTLLSPALLSFLQRGIGNQVRLWTGAPVGYQECLLPIHCPPSLVHYFTQGDLPRVEQGKILDGPPKLKSTTYLTKSFALSSVERGSFWNQSRALLAYAKNKSGPISFHLRLLRDDYDYSGANILASQEENNVLGAICFATDGGNKHCLLDRIKNATIEASDWRIRLELQGDLPKAPQLPEPGLATDEVSFPFGENTMLSFRFPWLQFGAHQPSWEMTKEEGKMGIDLILYQGPPRSFTFDASFPCVIGLALSIHSPEKSSRLESIRVETRGSVLMLDWECAPGQSLALAAPASPLKEQEIISFVGKALAHAGTKGEVL